METRDGFDLPGKPKPRRVHHERNQEKAGHRAQEGQGREGNADENADREEDEALEGRKGGASENLSHDDGATGNRGRHDRLQEARLPVLDDRGVGENAGEHHAHQKRAREKVGAVVRLGHARTQDEPEEEGRSHGPHHAAGLAVKADQFPLPEGVGGGPESPHSLSSEKVRPVLWMNTSSSVGSPTVRESTSFGKCSRMGATRLWALGFSTCKTPARRSALIFSFWSRASFRV